MSIHGEPISRQVNVFRGRPVPQSARLAGYAALIDHHNLELPLPPRLATIGGKSRPKDENGWLRLPERYGPADTLAGHLTFALKWEGVDLSVLDTLFRAIQPNAIEEAIATAPTGEYMRRVWFLFEWLREERLHLPDLGKVRAVDAVDTDLQVALQSGSISARHRVRDNLPGTRAFCPMVRRTTAVIRFQESRLAERARQVIGRTHPDVLARASAFLLLSDSRASFRIEGETPSSDRARRWGQAIARAGTTRISVEELENLQRIVIGDSRFVHLGLRTDGGFVGEHDRLTRAPLPEHISAKADDLPSLVTGIVGYDERSGSGEIDPVVAAAVEAFGFVYIHPFEDGNGRIHRWLIHHVLAAGGFAPPGIAFPISAVILRRLDEYRTVLESYSRPLLASIEWRPTDAGNVEVLNDSAPWYRFFDATAHAEFLYACVEATVMEDLPREVAFLEAYDRFVVRVQEIVDMPARTLDLLHRFLRQNHGRLSARARSREFSALSDGEAERIEAFYAEAHSGEQDPGSWERRASDVSPNSSPLDPRSSGGL